MSRHVTHFRRTALGATAPFACTALAACGGDRRSRRLILSIPCEVASGSMNAGVGRSTLATCPVLRRSSHPMRSWYVFSGERRWPSDTIPSMAQQTAPPCAGLRARGSQPRSCVEGGEDLVFRVVKSQAADREIDDFMTVPRSRRG